MRHAPWRSSFPCQQFFVGPLRGLVRMARVARIRNVVLVRHGRRDELEGMRPDERTRHALRLDLRQMAGHALAAGSSIFVVCVFLHGRSVRAVG